MAMALVGRLREQRTLQDALDSAEAELACIYGRRRIGKTFLVRQFFAKELCFELTGVFDAPLKVQLRNFSSAFKAAFGGDLPPPSDWQSAFAQLGDALARLPKRA